MEDSDDDYMDPSMNSVSLDDLQFFMRQLDPGEASCQSSQANKHNVETNSATNKIKDECQLARETPRSINKSRCGICTSENNVNKYGKIFVCAACKVFLWSTQRKRIFHTCLTGRFECELTWSANRAFQRQRCQSCRLKKAYEIGFQHPMLPKTFDEYLQELREPDRNAHHQDLDRLTPQPSTSSPARSVSKIAPADSTTATSSIRQSNQPSSKQKNRSRGSYVCDVCGTNGATAWRGHNLHACSACQTFLSYCMNRRIFSDECVKGHYQCDLSIKPLCRGCRIRKAIDLGFKHPALPVDYGRSNLAQTTTSDQTEDLDTMSSQESCARQLSSSPTGRTGHQALQAVEPGSSSSITGDRNNQSCSAVPGAGLQPICILCKHDATYKLNVVKYRRLVVCIACRAFLSINLKKNIFSDSCRLGRYQCDLTRYEKEDPRWLPPCRGCRLAAAIDLGLKHSSLPSGCGRRDLAQRAASNLNKDPGTSSSQEAYTPRQPVRKMCQVCGTYSLKATKSLEIVVCRACKDFLKYSIKRHQFWFACNTGRYECDLTLYVKNKDTKWRPPCRGCRIRKAIDVGLKHPALPADYDRYVAEMISSNQDLDTSTSQAARARQEPTLKMCQVCGKLNAVWYRKIIVCIACRSFIDYSIKKQTFWFNCNMGRYQCDLTWYEKDDPLYRPACRGCRLAAAIDLGLKHPNLPSGFGRSDLAQKAASNQTWDLGTSSSQEAYTPRQPVRKMCQVCGTYSLKATKSLGIVVCRACKGFLKYSIKQNVFFAPCNTGRYECDLTLYVKDKDTKWRPPCRGCRIRKAIDAGLTHPALPADYDRYVAEMISSNQNKNLDASNLQELRAFQRPIRRKCQVCPKKSQDSILFCGIFVCRACKAFLKYSIKTLPTQKHYECRTGTNQCDLTLYKKKKNSKWRPAPCRACRLAAAIEAGLEHPSIPEAILAKFKRYEHSSIPSHTATGSTLIPDANPPDQANPELDCHDLSESVEPAAKKVRTVTMAEIDSGGVDEFKLPVNIGQRFSRWLYNDLSCFQPGGVSPKEAALEIKPRAREKVVSWNDRINGQFGFLTEDLDSEVDQCEPIQDIIYAPYLEIRPSVSLLSASANDNRDKKHLLSFILHTRRTIVDRGPMIERRNAATRKPPDMIQNCQSSESLIGPGEDCDADDDGFDSEIIEIDCDV